MRKTFLAAVTALSLASALPALDISVHGGYTTFNMHDVNQGNAEFVGYYGSGSGYSQPIDSGFLVGADLTGPTAYPWLTAGLRGEFMMSNLAETKLNTYSFTDRANLSDLLVGLQASSNQGSGFSLGLGAWAGYGYATLTQNSLTAGLSQDGLFMGTLPVAEAEMKATYRLGQHIGLTLSGGYRWADAGYLYDDQHHYLFATGQNYWGGYILPISVDYSGITGQGSISYSF